ncbi:hypothetical protein HY091_00715 [Candidatus Kaiserbacteria bacterium]|nr:hypothetical protein [Candidatus Kaiserbacteria bacterium]
MPLPTVPDISLLYRIADSGFIAWKDEPVTFKNPALKSRVYVGGREDLTHNPDLLIDIGGIIVQKVWEVVSVHRRPCLIGIPSAGRPLAQAAATHPDGMFAFEVLREKKKEHGAHQHWVDGRPNAENLEHVTLDNTITDGASKLEWFRRLREDGYPVDTMHHLVLVDRQEGGIEMLVAAGYRVQGIWKLREILFAFAEHGIWPRERVVEGLDEISANRRVVSHS